jgi:hypothetical protein
MRLITVTGLKAYLEKEDNEHDGLLDIIINGVSASIEGFLNRNLEKKEYTYYFEADGNRKKYWLPAYPVDLAERFVLTVYGDTRYVGVDYFLREEEGLMTFYIAPIYYVPKDIKVIWTGGYELIDDSSDDDGSLDVPDDYRLATYMQCAHVFKRRNDTGVNIVTMPNGRIDKGWRYVKPGALLPEVKDLLSDYRRIPGRY